MQNGLLSWLLITARQQQQMSLAYLLFGLFKKCFLPQLWVGVVGAQRSFKGPAWNQLAGTTNVLPKCIITHACLFFTV